jgi:stage II sporulation protein E
MPTSLLHKPLGNGGDLPMTCRKSGRLLQELRHSQEQLRSIRADRDRQREYRAAVAQQYGFLAEYLQDVSDSLARRSDPQRQWYEPEIAVHSASRERENGDRCLWFAGVECRYYVLLCDGMGTGEEAAREASAAGQLLRKLLAAGFPPEHALRSLNSICALQGKAGAVTVDLCELRLDTGKAVLYKWGAAPSYVITRGEPIKIGTASPPPGLSVSEGRETVEKLSLRKGETLVLLSDGAGGEEALRSAWLRVGEPAADLAARILASEEVDGSDDATVAVIRLSRAPLSA